MPKFFLACAAAVLCGGAAFAQAGVCRECDMHTARTTVSVGVADAWDGLGEVNAQRAQRGLPPYQRDDALTQAAGNAARARAARGLAGHLANDFVMLPSGAHADAAGCAKWPVGMGWGSCETYGRYSYAGAAYVAVGGMRYMHLFLSNHSNGPVAKAAQAVAAVVSAVPHPVQTFQSLMPVQTCEMPKRGWFRRR